VGNGVVMPMVSKCGFQAPWRLQGKVRKMYGTKTWIWSKNNGLNWGKGEGKQAFLKF